jgi:hypothetical protein
VSADLDALDRGVIEAGVMAAEALARVAAVEAKVGALSQALAYATTEAGLPETAALIERSQRPDLRLVGA